MPLCIYRERDFNDHRLLVGVEITNLLTCFHTYGSHLQVVTLTKMEICTIGGATSPKKSLRNSPNAWCSSTANSAGSLQEVKM